MQPSADLPYMDMEHLVRVAEGPEVLAALSHRKAALWYYVSLAYFQSDATLSIPHTTALRETLTAELLCDVATMPLSDLRVHYKLELDRLIRFTSNLIPVRSTPLPPAPTNERIRILDLLKVGSVQPEHTSFLTYLEGRLRLADDACCICGSGESEPPDLIVLCSKCETAVHMRCYGILKVTEADWLCEVCKANVQVTCGLCMQPGSALKPTIHYADFPYARQLNAKEKMWVHVFCAKSIGASYLIPATKDLIDLSEVSMEYWQKKCKLCEETKGAVVTCSMCPTRFHPECWRRRLCPRPPWQRMMCALHIRQLSQQTILTEENKTIHEVLAFCKQISVGKLPLKKDFSPEETQMLQIAVNRLLFTSYSRRKTGFSLVIDLSNRYLNVSQPAYFNLLSPVVIKLCSLQIPNRTIDECFFEYLKVYPELVGQVGEGKEELTEGYFPAPEEKKRERRRRKTGQKSVIVMPLTQIGVRRKRSRRQSRRRR